MAEWCADLAALLDAEGYRRAVIAGHCLGANIAVEFASRYLAKAVGLVLIEPMPREALAARCAGSPSCGLSSWRLRGVCACFASNALAIFAAALIAFLESFEPSVGTRMCLYRGALLTPSAKFYNGSAPL